MSHDNQPQVIDPCFFSHYSDDWQRMYVSFATLGRLARIMEPRDFSQQLGLLVSQCPQRELVVADGSSHPHGFDAILKGLVDLQLITLVARSDVNANVGKTLGIDLLIPQGRLSLRPHWTAWKELRAQELVSALRWLWCDPFRQRVVVAGQHGDYRRLTDTHPMKFIHEVFALIEENHYSPEEVEILMEGAGWQAAQAGSVPA